MKKNYVKVRKKMRDEEGGEKWRMTIYKERGKKATMYKWLFTKKWEKRDLGDDVGDLIYRDKRKEIKVNTYLLFTKSLPWILATMLPWIGGN